MGNFSYQLNQQPHGVFIHSDIQPTNILIKDGQISALVDFEWSYAGSPSFEMALTRAGLYFSAFPSLDHSTFSSLSSLSLEQLYSILYTGYAKTNPIPLLEEHPQLTDFIWLLYMVGSWLWIKQSSTSQELSQFDEDIKRIHSQLIS